jgi:hypothetical protein
MAASEIEFKPKGVAVVSNCCIYVGADLVGTSRLCEVEIL